MSEEVDARNLRADQVDLWREAYSKGAEAGAAAARERVRVVEGERDAAHEAGYWVGYREGKDEAETRDLNYDALTARAESAEAAHAALRAGVEALDRSGRMSFDHSDLRALIATEAIA